MKSNFFRIIAIGADNNIFKQNRLFDKKWTYQYSGTGWASIIFESLKNEYIVVTADVALSNVLNEYWDPKSIAVIQHQDDPECIKLIQCGSFPLLLTSMESPIYSKSFLQNGKIVGESFRYRIIFGGLIDYFSYQQGVNYPLRFPSYYLDEIKPIKRWNDRKYMVAFMKNMYSNYFSPLYLIYPIDQAKFILKFIKRIFTYNYKYLFSKKFPHKQLHDKRIISLLYFSNKNKLELFGSGWNDLTNLPRYYQKKLNKVFDRQKPFFFNDKKEKISEYKFCLCFENASFSGSVSEKIIDCFVSGVIPVYLGANDIEKYVPKNTFVDLRDFENFYLLEKFLDNMSEEEAIKMIINGRIFLNSDEGKIHSYEGFANFLHSIINKENKC